jgi:hypothetical protein
VPTRITTKPSHDDANDANAANDDAAAGDRADDASPGAGV